MSDVAREVVRLAAERMAKQREDIIRAAIIHAGADPTDHEDLAKRGVFLIRPGVQTFRFDGIDLLEFYTPEHAGLPTYKADGSMFFEYYRKLY